MSDNFLNSKNLEKVLNSVITNVLQNTNINIEKYENTNRQFQQMAQIVNKKFGDNLISLDQLNEKLAINASRYFINSINNKKMKSTDSNLPKNNNQYLNVDYSDNQYVNASQVNLNKQINNSKLANNQLLKNKPQKTENYIVNDNIPEIIGENLPINTSEFKDEEVINLNNKVDDYLLERQRLMNIKDIPATDQNNLNDNINILMTSNKSEDYEENLKTVIEDNFKKLTNTINNNLVSPIIDNNIYKQILQKQQDIQPDYYIKSNYVLINSGDRDWLNEPNTYNRYNFFVKFGNHPYTNSATINNRYRNVTSVELVNCFLPKDCVLLPFDVRPYIDILSYPLLLLKIPELANVFKATNSSSDDAFSALIYDKKHDSSVLSTDYISGSSTSIVNTTPKTQFYTEYNKSYYKYIPAYFERKEFLNQPLAELTNMTLRIQNPNNENINVMPDVLDIEEISFTANLGILTDTDFEYDLPSSFPNDASRNNREMIRIKTTTSFSNKLFRIGDNIRIQGITTESGANDDETTFTTYLNRDSGHYILNSDISDNAAGANQGYTSNIYISPPGDIEFNGDAGLSSGTYLDSDTVNVSNVNVSNSKLINRNLQTFFLFKINTREADISVINKSINVT